MAISNRSNWFPLISLSVKSKSEGDWVKLEQAFAEIVANDPEAYVSFEVQNGEATVGGKSEAHLDGMLGSLIKQGFVLDVGAPLISYRETITCTAQADYTHKRWSGGVGQYAHVILKIIPLTYGDGCLLENKATPDSIPPIYSSGIEKGVSSVLDCGPVFGAPLVDIGVTLVDGAYHNQDSSVIAFEIAARAALRQALESAGAVLLEPIMKVAVATSEASVGGVIGDLNARRGLIVGTSFADKTMAINATVPLANMFGYANKLSSITHGVGTFVMEYSHHEAAHTNPDPDTFPPAIGMRA